MEQHSGWWLPHHCLAWTVVCTACWLDELLAPCWLSACGNGCLHTSNHLHSDQLSVTKCSACCCCCCRVLLHYRFDSVQGADGHLSQLLLLKLYKEYPDSAFAVWEQQQVGLCTACAGSTIVRRVSQQQMETGSDITCISMLHPPGVSGPVDNGVCKDSSCERGLLHVGPVTILVGMRLATAIATPWACGFRQRVERQDVRRDAHAEGSCLHLRSRSSAQLRCMRPSAPVTAVVTP